MDMGIDRRKSAGTFFLWLLFGLFVIIFISLREKVYVLKLQQFSVIFLGILIEALPFVVIGAIVSSVIHIFLSEEMVARFIPKNRALGLLFAASLGFVFPICECAIVPVMRRLLQKKVPLYFAVTFMLAVPILNPVVMLSTYYAFGSIRMPLMRGFFGMVGAMLVGHIMGILQKEMPFLEKQKEKEKKERVKSQSFQIGKKEVSGVKVAPVAKKKSNRVLQVIHHVGHEVYDVGRFLIIGSMLSASLQTFVPRGALLQAGNTPVLNILILMLLAFLLSLCSEADAFIARTFVGQFSNSSILAFLIFGPMLDVKNVLMLMGSFKKKFVLKLAGMIVLVCFALALMVQILEMV